MRHGRKWWLLALLLGAAAMLCCSMARQQARHAPEPTQFIAVTADNRGELKPCG